MDRRKCDSHVQFGNGRTSLAELGNKYVMNSPRISSQKVGDCGFTECIDADDVD